VKAIIGRKVGMTRVLEEDRLVAATVVLAEPNAVMQIKTVDRDGYSAVQLGVGDIKGAKKPQQGHAKKAGVEIGRWTVEFPLIETDDVPVAGSNVDVSTFQAGDIVNAMATSKGHGFTGTVKRHNFKMGPRSHGSMNVRAPGSIGSRYPQRVIKGKRMAGHYGDERTTVKHLVVLNVMPEQHLIVLKGSFPGVRGSRVVLTQSTQPVTKASE
jgi:large subunit ribosomal protein L3